MELIGHTEQLVSDAAHGGNDRNDLVALISQAFDPRRNVADAVEATDGCAAVFLNNQCHAVVVCERWRDSSAEHSEVSRGVKCWDCHRWGAII